MVEPVEFNQWLQKGMGRAVVYLKTHDPKPCREAVLYASLHNLAYDRQCEGSREVYLLDLIRSTGEEDFFRNELFRALTTGPEDPEFDLGQTIELARNFAGNGDHEIKQAMYDALVNAGFEEAGCYYSELIKLDGLPALLFVAEHFPATTPDSSVWQVGSLISYLQERDGEGVADEAIRRASEDSPRLAQMLEKGGVHRRGSEPRRKDQKRPDYPTLKRMIAESATTALPLVHAGWGRAASAEELEAATADLLTETDEKRLLAYLSIFRGRRFPGPTARLLELAQGDNVRLARQAVAVVSQINDPEIRSLGLRFLNMPGKKGDGADLLANNYQQEDFQLIAARLREPMETDELHHLEMGVRDLAKEHREPEAEQCLLLLYEKGPCSLCRRGIVEALITIDRFPEWMREECRWDAYADTRKLVG